MAERTSIADRLVVVLSDIEMGAGGLLDDFPSTGFLGELILAYNRPPFRDLAVDLVFNGDTFDLLKTPVDGKYPRRVTEQVAVAKLERVIEAHGDFFQALRRFLAHSSAERRAYFVVGNHDLELVFPDVRAAVAREAGERGVAFPGFTLDIGDLHMEHGAQVDPMFTVDTDNPLMEHEGEQILALPWGSDALLEVAIPLQRVMYDLDRLKPRRQVFELLPEVRDLLVGAFWRYWTRDYWRELLSRNDPMKRVSWTLLKEVVYRFGSLDTEVSEGAAFRRMVKESDQYAVIVLGHLHRPGWWSFGDRKVLHTGCFRDEFMMDAAGNVLRLIPKTYAEVYLRGERVARSHLVEVDGPPPPPGHVPRSVFDVLPRVRPLLEPPSERAAMEAARTKQEAREAKERGGPEDAENG